MPIPRAGGWDERTRKYQGEVEDEVNQCLTRIFHALPLRDRGDGRATGQAQGLESEAYLNSTSQGARLEDARKDCHTRGRSPP